MPKKPKAETRPKAKAAKPAKTKKRRGWSGLMAVRLEAEPSKTLANRRLAIEKLEDLCEMKESRRKQKRMTRKPRNLARQYSGTKHHG